MTLRQTWLHVCDEDSGPGVVPDHNLADLAVQIVFQDHLGSAYEQAVGGVDEALYVALRALIDDAPDALEMGVQHGIGLVMQAIEHGTRLGFALALTQECARDGWTAWLLAADQELARSGCSAAVHLETVLENLHKRRNTLTQIAIDHQTKQQPHPEPVHTVHNTDTGAVSLRRGEAGVCAGRCHRIASALHPAGRHFLPRQQV